MIIHKLVVKCVNTESIKEIFRVQTKRFQQKYDEEKKKRRVHLWASLNWVRVNNAVNWNAGSVYLLSQPNSITYSLTKRHRRHTQLS